ncbi:MAG: hypothetical protein OXC91_06600 [Rhodobacteraceae bacterium]|nr:hypothetical protein [Paracoccaceae bacterium]
MGVRINLALRDTLEQSSVSASGFNMLEMNADRANQFGLIVGTRGYHEKIWNACRQIYGRVPDWFFLRDILGREDQARYGAAWAGYSEDNPHAKEVSMIKEAVGARLVSVEDEPAARVSRKFENYHSTVPVTFDARLKDSLTTDSTYETSHGWSIGSETTVGVEVGGELSQVKAKVEQKISFGFSGGSSKSTSKGTGIEVEGGMMLTLEPGQKALVAMNCSRGRILVDVDYKCYLHGDAMFSFAKKHHNGKRDHLVDPDRIIEAMGKDPVIRITERTGLGFVSDGNAVAENA